MYKWAFVLHVNDRKLDYIRKYEVGFYVHDANLKRLFHYENGVAYVFDEVSFNKAEKILEHINDNLLALHEEKDGQLEELVLARLISKPKFKNFQSVAEIATHTV